MCIFSDSAASKSEENNEIQTEDENTTALNRKIVEDFRKLNFS